MLYWINLRYACAGVITNERGVIMKSAPIFKGFQGKSVYSLINYYKNRKALIEYKAIFIS